MHFDYEQMSPIFDKWHIRGLPIPAVIHRFAEPDFGDPHDHPWAFRSVILKGGYVEEVFDLNGHMQHVRHEVGDSFYIPATHIHRIVELLDGECWTMIMPQEANVQKSGFYQFREEGTFHRFWDENDFKKIL